MKWDVSISANGEEYYSSTSELTNQENPIPGYAYLLPGYALLNGSYKNTPDRIPEGQSGYTSSQISDENGDFADPPILRIHFDRLKTSRGITLNFNDISGDYADKVNIKWYKSGALVENMDFSPASSVYFCEASVKLHNEVEITFLHTSRPYRHIWISKITNYRLVDAGGLKIVYGDIALGAKENAEYSVNDGERLGDLKKKYSFPDVALSYPGYSLLNEDYKNYDVFPEVGYISRLVSDKNGDFPHGTIRPTAGLVPHPGLYPSSEYDPPTLTATFSDKYSSQGISLVFNDHSGDYCSQLTITWYRDGETLSSETFRPDGYEYFCYHPEEYYNRIMITFEKTSRPFRPVFLSNIQYGLGRTFLDDEAKNVDCFIEMSPISEELSINTLSFTIRSKSNIAFNFQRRQQMKLYFDENIIGIFYLKSGKRVSKTDYEVNTEDAVGLLDTTDFMGGIYNNEPVKNVIAAIFEGQGIDYFLDQGLENLTLSGYLPVCRRRDALAQVAFAIGASVNTAYDLNLYIYPRNTGIIKPHMGLHPGKGLVPGMRVTKQNFTKSNTLSGLTIDHSDITTGAKVYAHTYVKSSESEELYKDTLNGTAQITFSEAHYDLAITGGTISSSGDNWAIITGTGGEVVLTGKKYTHMTTLYEKANPNISQNENLVEVKDATLVNPQNVNEVLNRVYDYYSSNESVSCRVLLNEEELGDIVSVDTDFDGTRIGAIKKMDFTFTREMTAEVEIG